MVLESKIDKGSPCMLRCAYRHLIILMLVVFLICTICSIWYTNGSRCEISVNIKTNELHYAYIDIMVANKRK